MFIHNEAHNSHIHIPDVTTITSVYQMSKQPHSYIRSHKQPHPYTGCLNNHMRNPTNTPHLSLVAYRKKRVSKHEAAESDQNEDSKTGKTVVKSHPPQ